jgi:hypothetical protein
MTPSFWRRHAGSLPRNPYSAKTWPYERPETTRLTGVRGRVWSSAFCSWPPRSLGRPGDPELQLDGRSSRMSLAELCGWKSRQMSSMASELGIDRRGSQREQSASHGLAPGNASDAAAISPAIGSEGVLDRRTARRARPSSGRQSARVTETRFAKRWTPPREDIGAGERSIEHSRTGANAPARFVARSVGSRLPTTSSDLKNACWMPDPAPPPYERPVSDPARQRGRLSYSQRSMAPRAHPQVFEGDTRAGWLVRELLNLHK